MCHCIPSDLAAHRKVGRHPFFATANLQQLAIKRHVPLVRQTWKHPKCECAIPLSHFARSAKSSAKKAPGSHTLLSERFIERNPMPVRFGVDKDTIAVEEHCLRVVDVSQRGRR